MNELYHYGVKGMKWGERKAQKYERKTVSSRESAAEWKEIGQRKADKLRSKGFNLTANKVQAKYDKRSDLDLRDANIYSNKAAVARRKQNFRVARNNISNSRSRGSKVVTAIMAGPFGNRLYDSALASGESKNSARTVTAMTRILGGSFGQLYVSALYTNAAGKNHPGRL